MNDAPHNDSPMETGAMTAHLFKLEEEALNAEREAVKATQHAADMRSKFEKAKQVLIELGFPMPKLEREAIPAPKPRTGGRRKKGEPTWTGEVLNIVEREGIISYPDLKDLLSIGPLADRMRASDKSFYGALLKLYKKGKIVRHNDHAFTPEAFAKYQSEVTSGLRDEISSKSKSRSGSIVQGILEYLEDKEHGASGKEIIDSLDLPNPNSAYNSFARMVDREQLVKDEKNKTYRLAKYPEPKAEPKTAASEMPPSREGELPLNEPSHSNG